MKKNLSNAEGNVKKKVDAITNQLEKSIEELLDSENYANYLNTIAKFHRYSMNNCILIGIQMPEATMVAGYNAWKTKFNRQVKKGEKAITILAPVIHKTMTEKTILDPNTGQPVLGENGEPQKEMKEIKLISFRPASVFDISQTEGEPLPSIQVEELTGSVKDFSAMEQAIIEIAPFPVEYMDIDGRAKGFFDQKRIVVQTGMSEAQTLKTLIHETAHSVLHKIDGESAVVNKDRNTKEVEAESVAYTVCKHFNLDTSDYSFGYIAGWGSGREMEEFKKSLELIRNTSADLIDAINEALKLRSCDTERRSA